MSVDNTWQRGARNALDQARLLIEKRQLPAQVRANGTTLRRLTFGEVLNKDELTRSAQAGTLYKLVSSNGKLGVKPVSTREFHLLCTNQQYAAIMQLFRSS